MKKLRYVFLYLLLPSLLTGCKPVQEKAFDLQLAEMVSSTNKLCPMRIGEDLQMDSLRMPDHRTFAYYYSYTRALKNQVNAAKLEGMGKPASIQKLKADKRLAILRDHKITFRYTYLDKKGQLIGSYTISPEDYKE